MKQLFERLLFLIKHFENNSQSQFAKKIGCPQTTFNGYLNSEGQEKIKFSLLEKVLFAYPSVSKEWLFFGQQPIFINEVKNNLSDSDIKKLQAENERLKKELAEADRVNRKLTARFLVEGDFNEESAPNTEKAAGQE